MVSPQRTFSEDGGIAATFFSHAQDSEAKNCTSPAPDMPQLGFVARNYHINPAEWDGTSGGLVATVASAIEAV